MSVTPPEPLRRSVIPTPPFAILPDPGVVFRTRARRLDFLAGTSPLGPYLRLLSGIAGVQAGLCHSLSAPPPVDAGQVFQARAAAMPPLVLDPGDPDLAFALDGLLEGAAALAMPAAARTALDAVVEADAATRAWLAGNVLAEEIPGDGAAAHLFVAAAVQVHATRRAAGLDAGRLVPVRVGVCPACGGRPASSLVVGFQGAENGRYAACHRCSTLWNEVRVKCLACGSTKGIGFRSLDDGSGAEPVIKAETCDSCHSWVKVLYQTRDPSLEPVADDVASLALDLMMRPTEWRRAGFDPFLVGYG